MRAHLRDVVFDPHLIRTGFLAALSEGDQYLRDASGEGENDFAIIDMMAHIEERRRTCIGSTCSETRGRSLGYSALTERLYRALDGKRTTYEVAPHHRALGLKRMLIRECLLLIDSMRKTRQVLLDD